MAKIAKKTASSTKKSASTKKVVAKKAVKQKKAAVKAAPSKKAAVSKKAAAPKKSTVKKAPVSKAKKAVVKKVAAKPVKAVSKKTVAAKPAKPAKKASPAKPAPKKPAPKAKPAPVVKKAAVKELKKKPLAEVAKTAPVKPIIEKPAKTSRRKSKKDDDDDDEEVVVFRKPVKAKTSVTKKTSSKQVYEELTLEGPVPKRVGPIVMSSDEKLKLKKALLHKCIDIQKNNVAMAKKAMEEAQYSANEEKVSEELSDSFRESMHATRDMYARQLQEGVNNLGLLNRIMILEHERVKFGSVVFTNFQNYFISTGLGEIKVDDKSFQTVSTLSPLFQILADKRKGDTFMFLDRLYTVIEIF